MPGKPMGEVLKTPPMTSPTHPNPNQPDKHPPRGQGSMLITKNINVYSAEVQPVPALGGQSQPDSFIYHIHRGKA